MSVSKALKRIFSASFAVTILLFATGGGWAQADSVRKKRLQSPAAVKGFVGGEAHDGYAIRVRKNQTLKVQISWQGKDARAAQFVVSRSADFFSGDAVEGGKETSDGKIWVGTVPATGDYYIYVTAHPMAKYTLKVSVK